MYILLWILSVNFLCSHWEKYNTGIMYLPWGYDVSQVTIFTCYMVAGFHGTAIFYSPIISDINAIHLLKFSMYAGSGMLLSDYRFDSSDNSSAVNNWIATLKSLYIRYFC